MQTSSGQPYRLDIDDKKRHARELESEEKVCQQKFFYITAKNIMYKNIYIIYIPFNFNPNLDKFIY